jgi:hypothetical protein
MKKKNGYGVVREKLTHITLEYLLYVNFRRKSGYLWKENVSPSTVVSSVEFIGVAVMK